MNKALVLVLLVAAGAVFAGGYVVGSGATDRAALDLEYSDATMSSGAASEPEAPMSADGPRPQLAANEQLSSLRAAIASFDEPAPERGHGSISGTVIATAGGPVSGVEVSAIPKRADRREPRSDDPDEQLLSQLRRRIESANWIKANRVTVTTGADGTFTLDGLTDRAHSVTARLEGWSIRATDRNAARAATPDTTIEFSATKKSGLALEVFLPDGTKPERASIRLESGTRSRTSSWRPDHPTFEGEPGAYQLRVTAGEDSEFQAGPSAVEILEGEVTPLRVDLEGRPVLTIRVDFPEDEETGGGEIYRMRVASGDRPTAAALRARGESVGVRGSAGRDWKKTIPDVKPGSYAIGYARGSNRGFAVIDIVDVGVGHTEHVLEVPPLQKDEYVVVRVQNPDGQPIPNANISTGYFSKNASSSGSSPTVNQGEGIYWVLHHAHPWKNDPAGTFWISVTAGALGKKRVEYKQGVSGPIDIDFDPPATLSVTVQSGSYEGLVHVWLMRGNDAVANAACDHDGQAVFSGLQPGVCQVQLRVGSGHWPASVHSEDLTVKPGSNALRIALPPLYTVTVRGVGSHAWLQKQEQTQGQGRRFHKNAQAIDGEAVFDGLPAGDYTVSSDGGQTKFSVPGSSIVVLQERK